VIYVPTYGIEKTVDIKRSLLPAKARSRRAARSARARAHARHRAGQRQHLSRIQPDTSFTEIDRSRSIEVNQNVSTRRSADKLGPFLRWATAQSDEWGGDAESRLSAARSVLGSGLIADHAISHLRWLEPFRTDNWTRYSVRDAAYLRRRAQQAQSLHDQLCHRLGTEVERLGDLNRLIKRPENLVMGARTFTARPLRGAHDIDDFVGHIMKERGPTLRVVLEFVVPAAII
jgi:hypothetical protein